MGGASPARRGPADAHPSRRRRPRKRPLLAAAVLLALLYLFFGGSGSGGGGERSAATCAAALRDLGLDFGAAAADGGGGVAADANVGDAAGAPRARARRLLYDSMAQAAAQRGLSLGGVVTQGLSQADLFAVSAAGAVAPILRPLGVPVRAIVAPLLDERAAATVGAAVARALGAAVAPSSLWLQDPKLVHATVHHASSHAQPVTASAAEVEAEAAAIAGVAAAACPVRATIERLLLTSSGVVVACWQALPGGAEPADIRAALAAALPRAPGPAGQMVREPLIFHTTVARLLAPLRAPHSWLGSRRAGGGEPGPEAVAADVAAAVAGLSSELCGLTATFSELWFVEERDLLALALRGNFSTRRRAPLLGTGCGPPLRARE